MNLRWPIDLPFHPLRRRQATDLLAHETCNNWWQSCVVHASSLSAKQIETLTQNELCCLSRIIKCMVENWFQIRVYRNPPGTNIIPFVCRPQCVHPFVRWPMATLSATMRDASIHDPNPVCRDPSSTSALAEWMHATVPVSFFQLASGCHRLWVAVTQTT